MISPPSRSRVVIIGGGIIGTSIAYHLAHAGCSDVVLLEQHQLTAGTTWHAAGLVVTFGSLSETSTELRKYTRDLYAQLETETGLATGFNPVGFIEVATDSDRLEEYRRIAAFNRYCGIDVHEISPHEVGVLFPLARTDDVLAGFYVAEDGKANPVDATMSLARGARQLGIRIVEGIIVTEVLTTPGKEPSVRGVRTDHGDIECDIVVNCAGMWARQLGAANGVSIPLQAAEHYYLITEQIAGIPRDMPVLEDPASHGYYREEVGGLMIGLFEPVCAPWNVGGIPGEFAFGEIDPDWDRMGPYIETAIQRVPIVESTGIKKFFCGPESFTPDLQPVVGEAPEIKNYFVCAGLNSIGILTGGGLGRVMAQWILDGDPGVDVTGFNIDRLHAFQTTPEYRATRTVESLGMVYQTHFPGRPMQSARGAKRSPLHERLAAAGAYFKDVSGWESPDWYAPEGEQPQITALSWGRQNWFPYWEAEHRAARNEVIMMDMSFMAKFRVEGNDAGKFIDYLSANCVDGPTATITYTQWLNGSGRIEADLTVTKLNDQSFFVVASDTAHRHVLTWMRRNLDSNADVHITDVTSAYAQLNVQGPNSRDLLQSITDADLSNAAFPYRHARTIAIGFANVFAIRITYLGELGYELYVPTEQAVHVYDRIVTAGTRFGLRHAGLKALSSLRMEKGYRDYGHDIDNTDNPINVGLGFAVNMSNDRDFIGREAVAALPRAADSCNRLLQILVTDPAPQMFHAEVVRRNGIDVGYMRAASYGFTLGGAIGLAMIQAHEPITRSWVDDGTWEVDIAGRRFPAIASISPMYDPNASRIKG